MNEVGRKDVLAKQVKRIVVVTLSFLIAFTLGAMLLLLQKENPLEIFKLMFIAPLQTKSGIIKVLGKTTPLLFAGLSVAVAFRCSMFNIGVEGQLYVGGLVSALLGVLVTGLPPVLHVIVCLLGAMLAGSLVALLPALLKVRFNVHEVISTMMLNYVVSALITLFIVKLFRSGGEHARSPSLLASSRLHQFKPPEQLNSGIIIALALSAVVYVIFRYSPLGWRIEAAGKNLLATRFSGINANKLIVTAMMISGAIAALVGAERVMGAFGYMELNFSPGFGYTGIAIAVIANNNPIGIVLVSFLMGLMSHGGLMINIYTGVPVEWASVLSAFIFISVVAGSAFLEKIESRDFKYTEKADETIQCSEVNS